MVERIGRHRVRVGSLVDGIDELMCGDKATVFYCDPPWGNAMLKFFQTLRKKQTGVDKQPVDNDRFLAALGTSAKQYARGPVFVEYGLKWADQVIRAMVACGLLHIDTLDVWYGSGKSRRPMHLHVFTAGAAFELSAGHRSAIQSTQAGPMVIESLRPYVVEGGIVVDPCCGFGYTAKAAVHHGMRFYGNELNDARLERAREFLGGR